MMRSIHLGLQLPFSTPEDQKASEQFLNQLLIFNCVVNHRYLLQHPQVPLLYDSGVTYAPPAQAAPNRLSLQAIGRIEKALRAEGAERHLIEAIVRLLNGVEEFVDVGELYRRGKGDCNELTPVRVAELWRADVMASPLLLKAPTAKGITYHAVVAWPDGRIEDPSMILGMGGRAREVERRAEILKNRERHNAYVDAGAYLIQAEGADERVVAHQIGLLGLLPTSGVFPR